MLTESKYLSRIIWGAGALLVVAAFVVPGTTESDDDQSVEERPLGAFDLRVHDFEERLHTGDTTDDDWLLAVEAAPYLKARALSEAGSLTEEEVELAARRFVDYQYRIASEEEESSRRRLQNRRNSLILNDIERIDADQARDALEDVRATYDAQFGVDPGLMTETDDEGQVHLLGEDELAP